ncbi:dehydrase and lipid transport-domain-containing protein [Rhodocollybia butyracea]|uniref:Dehydrase and lipid transport-domain-containing protein n=1 Tax=Rhodocollybia butyracea TaxID=206335 RepID=A0A9P5Q067_9AGAR|nr:dehydrase and lipid transport-domain-containing protein [Rhodocollybia butyracea]
MLLLRRRVPFTSTRTFFSFSLDAEKTYHESKIIPYNKQQLFKVVANVSSYQQFVPFCTESRILNVSTPSAQDMTMIPYTMEAKLTVGFLSFNESYISNVKCVPFSSVEAVASSSTPLFKSLSTVWRFEDDEKNSNNTLVTLDLSYAFANPVHAAVSSTFFGQVSKQMVQAFEDRCKKVYRQ